MKLLLCIIIGLLIYIICKMGEGNNRKPNRSFRKILPEYRGKTCEILLKEPLMVDILFSIKGILVDVDEEWVMVETREKKKKVTKIFRVDNVSGINEIV